MKRFLPLAAVVVGCLALGFAGLALMLPNGRATPGVTVGGPFALQAPDGRTVTDKDMAGRPFLVFFGYTHCPDVCPASLAEISAMFKELGPEAKAQALFISVDPERDTPEAMKDYMSNFDPRIIALSGTPEQIKAVAGAYKAYFKKGAEEKDGSYSLDHVAMTYLMDKNGRFIGALNLEQPAKDAATEFRKYM